MQTPGMLLPCRTAVRAACVKQCKAAEPMTRLLDLPEVLLSIIVRCAVEGGKNALRATCKQLCSLVDDACLNNYIACATTYSTAASQHIEAKQLYKAKKCIHQLRILSLPLTSEGMLKYMPWNLAELYLKGDIPVSKQTLQAIGSLQNLTTLSLNCSPADADACLPPMASLVFFQASKRIGSLRHLAHTLCQLELTEFHHATHVEYLTNLQVLICDSKLPEDFFKTHEKLPLKHLGFRPCGCTEGHQGLDLIASGSPTTLISLSILGECCAFWQGGQPTTIQRLTLHDVMEGLAPSDDYRYKGCKRRNRSNEWYDLIEEASQVLPELMQLGISLGYNQYDKGLLLRSLAKFKSIHTLQLHIGSHWDKEKVLQNVKEVVDITARGVHVQVFKNKAELEDMRIPQPAGYCCF